MIRIVVPSILIVVLLATPRAHAAEEGYLPATTPHNVMENLERAYTNRDIDAYLDVIAQDFVFLFTGSADVENGSWRRDTDSTGVGGLFSDEHIRDIHLDVEILETLPGTPGNGGMLMVRSRTIMDVTLDRVDEAGEPVVLHTESGQTFYLRRGRTPRSPFGRR